MGWWEIGGGVAGWYAAFVFETREMSCDDARAETGRTITESPDGVPDRPLYVADYVNQRLHRVLEHEAITLSGLCKLNDTPASRFESTSAAPWP